MLDNDWDGTERRHAMRTKSALEQHAQTILSVVVTGLIIWFGNSVVEQGKEQVKTGAITATKIESLERTVNSLQDQVLRLGSERVTIGDVRRIEERVDRLERRK